MYIYYMILIPVLLCGNKRHQIYTCRCMCDALPLSEKGRSFKVVNYVQCTKFNSVCI